MQDQENDPLSTNGKNTTDSDNEPVYELSSNDTETASAPDISEPIDYDDNGAPSTKEESHARRIFRKVIRWSVGLLIVFGLGFLAATFTIYNPKLDDLNQSKTDLVGASKTISELEATISDQQEQIDSLNGEISTLNQQIIKLDSEKQDLAKNQNNSLLTIALLKARADVVSTQVKLYEGNSAQARVLLESASRNLTSIESLLPNDLKDVVAPLHSRLELAMGEIDDDPETAIADLGILAGDLFEIENALFNE